MGTCIVIGNHKGGVGSTPLIWNLSVQLLLGGATVQIIDCTMNSLLGRWNAKRSDRGLSPIPFHYAEPGTQLDVKDVDFTLVDVGRSLECIKPMLHLADIWLAPNAASQYEIDATLRLFDWWRQARGESADAVFAILFARIAANERGLEQRARLELACAGAGPHVLNHSLSWNTAWTELYYGPALAEMKNSPNASKASAEFNTMLAELMARAVHRLARPSHLRTMNFARVAEQELV